LDMWERTQGGHAPGQGQTGHAGVMRKDFDGGEWTGRHKGQFDDLIAQARAKRKAKVATEEKEQDDTREETTVGDSMEGLTPTTNGHANGSNSETATIAKPQQPSTNLQQHVDSSPAASMLHSAAQDLRRRSSVSSNGPPVIPGLISTHSIPSDSPTGSPLRRTSKDLTSRPSQAQAQPSALPSALSQEDSLAEKMAESLTDATAEDNGKLKTMDMFRLPESPVNDIEGLGAAPGG
jgi:hypothetical protein